MFILHKFLTRGIGVVTQTYIDKDQSIGYYYTIKSTVNSTNRTHGINGVLWYETYPLGRYVNHNHDTPNLTPELDGVGLLLKTNQPIEPFTELTVNYNDLAKLSNYQNVTIDFEYVPEKIEIKKTMV